MKDVKFPFIKKKYKKEMWGNYPSIIALMFGKRETDIRYKMFLEDAQKQNIIIRPIELIDISIPINEHYNDAVNFLRKYSNPYLKSYWDKIPLKNLLLKKLPNATEFNYENFKPEGNLKYGSRGITPLLVDTKSLNHEDISKLQKKKIKAIVNGLQNVEDEN